MQRGEQQLVRNAVFWWEKDFRLDAYADGKDVHVPNPFLGAVNRLGDPQYTNPTADHGYIAKQLVAGLKLLASVKTSLSEARDLRPSLLELFVSPNGKKVEPVVHFKLLASVGGTRLRVRTLVA